MIDIVQLTEQEFFQWLKSQLEKRDLLYSKHLKKEKIKDALYEILFYEQQLTAEDIERFFIPFNQAGYLSARNKFEIMLFILEKDYGKSFLFMEGEQDSCIVTEDQVESEYLQWISEDRMFLSEEEKKEFFVQNLMDHMGLGVMEVLRRIATDGILVGELCPALESSNCAEERLAVYTEGKVIHFPFLRIEDKEELIRIVKYAIAMENRGELSVLNPMIDFVKEDGTCITAVRPPAGKDWGIRILYGAAGKERIRWE